LLAGELPGPRPRPGASGHRAYVALRDLILEGEYAPGQRLKEVEVAHRLGTSRTPVREAVLQLELEGLVHVTPRRGAMVRELTDADVHEMFTLRAVLEGFCAGEAAARMDEQAIDELEERNGHFERCLARRRPGAPAATLVRLNAAFHEAVMAGSGNTRVPAVVDKLTAVPAAWKAGFWSSARQREAAIVYHREIVDAIRARDPMRADAVMKSHVYAAKDYFTDRLRRAGELA
jgi:DNA-binding GntR family transcriptional regulator